MNYTIGADPELFLSDAAGALVAVCEKIGGTKTHPLPLPMGDGFTVQEDNVALEFNIPPAKTQEELRSYLHTSINFLSEYFKTAYQLDLNRLSAASFPTSELQYDGAKVFGCDPDFNAWTRRRNPKPVLTDPNLRSAGGHIHVGHAFKDNKHLLNWIKCMDLFLGVPSVLKDNGILRKQLYGKAGAYRVKPYGGEYRVLSNYWIFEDTLIDWVWAQTGQAVAKSSDLDFMKLVEEDSENIINAINNNDISLANDLIDAYELTL